MTDDGLQVGFIHIHVKVGKVQYAEAFEGLRQARDVELVVGGVQPAAVVLSPPEQTGQFQANTDEAWSGGDVFQVERMAVRAEYTSFRFPLNAQALARVYRAKAEAQAILQEVILIVWCMGPGGHCWSCWLLETLPVTIRSTRPFIMVGTGSDATEAS